ncbi:serine hydrolase domain-containing protein [Bacillus sp. PS06]|uniref:serine hydrolase domain-containing protein n=1 Tax=Bacillus sp. PS06 TaxID=2764176 RepID=UPI001780A080|nr:serine hydrolase domain-containing protein [Bacillus sp. PS06]MBD8069825.1 beta-lactamase family protein [Bacillus sp. PS06]
MIKQTNVGLMLLIFISLSFLFTPRAFSATEMTTPSGIQVEDLEEFVDEYVKEHIGHSVAGASIVIVKDQEIIFSKGYGYGDIASEVVVEPDTSVMEWGSVTKLFVWTSVMQLVEQGLIDLNEDISVYLPDGILTKLNYDEPITMLELMHHTAGFEDRIFDLLMPSPEMTTLEETLKLTEPNQVYRPGEVVAYSNYSTSLAAYIVEQLTGEPFHEYVEEHIFSKIDMNQSTTNLLIEDDPDIIENKTKGYTMLDWSTFDESVPFYIPMYPSGGMNGTAEDLARFAMALMPGEGQHTPLFEQDQTLHEMLSTSYSVNEDVPGIAHGFWEYAGKYRGLTHSGNTVAFSTNFHIVPEENFGVVVLTNQAGEGNLLFGLVSELVGEKEFTVEENLPSTSEVEGTYLSSRRMMDGFINLYYYYFIPLDISAVNDQEIEINASGYKANYRQTSPYVYQLTDGNPAFIPNQIMYFHVNDGVVKQISTTYADYLPMDKSQAWLTATLVIFIVCLLYFLIAPFVLLVRAIVNRKKKSTKLSKWNVLLTLSGTGIIINIVVLAIRMLTNSNRAYSELYLHFGLNYVLTASAVVSLVLLLVRMKKALLTKWQKTGYIMSVITMILLIAWMIVWQVYR